MQAGQRILELWSRNTRDGSHVSVVSLDLECDSMVNTTASAPQKQQGAQDRGKNTQPSTASQRYFGAELEGLASAGAWTKLIVKYPVDTDAKTAGPPGRKTGAGRPETTITSPDRLPALRT